MNKYRTLFGAFIILLNISSFAHEGEDHDDEEDHLHAQRVLGELSFPTSTKSDEAQMAFEQGMLLLHLFEYPFAREEFRRAQELDPEFAMAYWGEAMTFNHPIWDEQDLHAARAVLAALGATPDERIESTAAPRERGLIASLDVLYGHGSKAERDLNYMRTLELLAATFPEDHEIQLFYALSILGVHAGVREISAYMMTTAIAEGVFAENPQHPGAAHYLIHGVDDPVHAVLGLRAARALAVMAPDAGHSLHMTSHIFTALGMWRDVVDANREAVRVQNEMRLQLGEPERSWGHYNFWLLYGLLQQGRVESAAALLAAARKDLEVHRQLPESDLILDPDRSIHGSVVQMWARYLIETRDWQGEISDWSFTMGSAFDPNLNWSYIQGMRAAHEMRASGVTTWLSQFQKLKSDLEEIISKREEQAPTDLLYLRRLEVMELQLWSAYEEAKGETQAALKYARQASDLEGAMPVAFGPPFVDLPSAEWLGELLLKAGEFSQAVEILEIQLQRSRQKSSSLRSLVAAHQGLGENAEALYHLQRLNLNWQNADEALRKQLEASGSPVARSGTLGSRD